MAAAWLAKQPERRADIEKRLAAVGAEIASKPSLRFVLVWETDANDVDFHIRDGKGGHASYRRKELRSGGELYADVTTGSESSRNSSGKVICDTGSSSVTMTVRSTPIRP